MIKNLFFISLCSILSVGAFAEDMPQPPVGGPMGAPGGKMMANLTEE